MNSKILAPKFLIPLVLGVVTLLAVLVYLVYVRLKTRRIINQAKRVRVHNVPLSVPALLQMYASDKSSIADKKAHESHSSPTSAIDIHRKHEDHKAIVSESVVLRMFDVVTVDKLRGTLKVDVVEYPNLSQEISLDVSIIERFISEMGREKPIRFTPNQLKDLTWNYSVRLGSGGFGVVYEGRFPNGVQVAVKILNDNRGEGVKEQFMAEVSTIGRTYHKNLVKLYGFCFDSSMKALVYEFMENGSLDMILFSKNQTIKWEKLYEITIGIAKGLSYLHEHCDRRIIHYDIKPGNILLDSNMCPKIADFGLAKLCNRDSSHVTMTGGRGTPGYAAPELWMPFPVTHKCDVYSYGMMLFEIFGRRRNLNLNLSESNQWFPRQVWEKFEKKELDEMINGFGIEEKDRNKAKTMVCVALWCAQYLPETRPSMSKVVKILEEGEQVTLPPNPFLHLGFSSAALALQSKAVKDESLTTDSSTSTSDYRNYTTIMKKYEIEMAI